MKKQKYKTGFIIAVIFLIILSVSGSGALIYGLNRFKQLQSNYNTLNSDHNSLKSQYTSLKSEHNSLQSQYNTKKTEYNGLKSNYNNLQGNYNSLQNDYDSLMNQYEGYSKSIEFRYGDGDDCKIFVTPDDSTVASTTRSILGHYGDDDLSWNDMRDIFDWIVDNVEYNYDTFIGDRRNCYFYPSETLDFGYGDCEDQSVLMLSMCKAEEDVSWIYCAGVSYYSPKKGKTVAHIFVILDVADDKMYIFDPTHRTEPFWGDEEGWESSSSKSEYEAILEYENYWGYSNLRIKKIFNNDFYRTFDSNQEFFDQF